MDSLFDILRKIQNKNPALKQRIREATALERWSEAVGPHIARHTRVNKVHEGVLWVEVYHPIWKSELHHRRRQILERLNQERKEASPAQPPGSELEIIQDLLLLDPRGNSQKKPFAPVKK